VEKGSAVAGARWSVPIGKIKTLSIRRHLTQP
jgi:hypothetical protein